MRPEEKPVITKSDSPTHDTVETHPAYAQITASRISGGARLYGSDFLHQNFVRVRIGPSELHRGLSNDSLYGSTRGFIEVDMSEAQWAGFVSSMSVGFGVPCTLRYKDNEEIPGIAAPDEGRKEQFTREAKERAERALDQMDALAAEIEELKLSEKAKTALRKRLQSAQAQLTSSIPFVLDQFGEHMEATVEKAKVEVNAYVVNAVQRAGLQALGVTPGSTPMIGFDGGDDAHQN